GGRRENSAPMWAAYVAYPAYRSKNRHVNTFEERMQGCFRFSMNGKAPPLGDPVLVALESYAYWLARGAPTGALLAGRGYPKLAKPPLAPDARRGAEVYRAHCALCHGRGGAGRTSRAGYVAFPPLWGADSFNWGAGMASFDKAAGFIAANMPFSQGGSLDLQQSWDVALYIDSRPRPQDPRYAGDVAATRAKYHDSPYSMYGRVVDGRLLGGPGPP
ncbi:MAG TPA: c-type cytochrome, partial [Ideonella sp.]|nr:c-type cytochrome [Ideonella sp.]